MNRTIWLKQALGLLLTLLLYRLLLPSRVQAHEGTGFHPEAVWALLRTGLLVAAAIAALVGVLWIYERAKSRWAK